MEIQNREEFDYCVGELRRAKRDYKRWVVNKREFSKVAGPELIAIVNRILGLIAEEINIWTLRIRSLKGE